MLKSKGIPGAHHLLHMVTFHKHQQKQCRWSRTKYNTCYTNQKTTRRRWHGMEESISTSAIWCHPQLRRLRGCSNRRSDLAEAAIWHDRSGQTDSMSTRQTMADTDGVSCSIIVALKITVSYKCRKISWHNQPHKLPVPKPNHMCTVTKETGRFKHT
jgi:hypothetical protein